VLTFFTCFVRLTGRDEDDDDDDDDVESFPSTTPSPVALFVGVPDVAHALKPDAQCLMPALPRGVIVGSAIISTVVRASCPDASSGGRCTRAECPCHLYEWHLTNVKRYKRPRKVKRQR